MRDTLNLPIDYDPGRNTYYYMEKVTHLPVTQITHSEVAALVLAKLALESFHCPAFTHDLRSALQKLLVAFSEELTVDMKQMEALISFQPSGYPSLMDYSHFQTVYQALHDGVKMDLVYTTATGKNADKTTARTVQPRHLTCYENAWHLLTDDLLSGDDRTFQLSRIREARSTGQPFKPKKKFNREKALKDFGIYGGENEETIRPHCHSEIHQFIVERRWHESQEIARRAEG